MSYREKWTEELLLYGLESNKEKMKRVIHNFLESKRKSEKSNYTEPCGIERSPEYC